MLSLLCTALGRHPRVLRCVETRAPTNASLVPLYFKFHKTGSELVKELLMERWLKCGFQLQPRFRYECGLSQIERLSQEHAPALPAPK